MGGAGQGGAEQDREARAGESEDDERGCGRPSEVQDPHLVGRSEEDAMPQTG